MKEKRLRHIAIAVLFVFTFFYCGNILFVHAHGDGNTRIVHSHPYLPSTHHSHSAGQFAGIALANASLASAITVQSASLQRPETTVMALFAPVVEAGVAVVALCCGMRAPPVSD